jgi:hypothetical protein
MSIPAWVLSCPQCKRDFGHSEIDLEKGRREIWGPLRSGNFLRVAVCSNAPTVGTPHSSSDFSFDIQHMWVDTSPHDHPSDDETDLSMIPNGPRGAFG